MADATCVEDGCSTPVGRQGARGMCSMHYQRFKAPYKRAGLPMPPSPRMQSIRALDDPARPAEPGVDVETEVLTDRGWARWSQATTRDRAYALNLGTMTAAFEPIRAVNIYPAKPRQLRHLEIGGFSTLSTPHHRWPIRYPRSQGYGHNVDANGWTTTAGIRLRRGIFRTLPNQGSPKDKVYSDAFVELVAWVWNEGTQARYGTFKRINIAQSHTKNPEKCARIELALTGACGRDWSKHVRRDGGTDYQLNKAPCLAIGAVLEQDKAPTVEFVLSMTQSQLVLFIDTCIAGDGSATETGVRRWMQRSIHSIRRFEMICALAGVPTNTRFKAGERYESHFGRDIWCVGLLRQQIAKPIDSLAELTSARRKGGRVEATDDLREYDGAVWCPVTPSKTWLARRNGAVYFTGAY